MKKRHHGAAVALNRDAAAEGPVRNALRDFDELPTNEDAAKQP
jgi:hypothetical protein